MKRVGAVAGMVVAAVSMIVTASWSGDTPHRPKILGIAGVQIASSNVPRAREFYRDVLVFGGDCEICAPRPMSEEMPSTFVGLPTGGHIEIIERSGRNSTTLLTEVAFLIDDNSKFKKFLSDNHIKFKEIREEGGSYLSVADPEGHTLRFITSKLHARFFEGHPRLIHAGWVVKDREAMDRFYRDVLGFRLYWQGGMKDDRVDWVSMQVPDGTDWIEYMLNVPADADKHLLGVMNHIALGVPDVRAAAEQLQKNGVKLTEEPKIGRDGKWQLNLYDPDDTRVELMEFTPVEKPCCAEFTPVEKPCCAEFTGEHPKP